MADQPRPMRPSDVSPSRIRPSADRRVSPTDAQTAQQGRKETHPGDPVDPPRTVRDLLTSDPGVHQVLERLAGALRQVQSAPGWRETHPGDPVDPPRTVRDLLRRGRLQTSDPGVHLAIEKLAGALHQAWQEEQGYEPRIRPTTDRAWITSHGGATTLDIANTPFKDLPTDWQAENRASATAAIGIVKSIQSQRLDLTEPAVIEMASARLHENWLSRNGSRAPKEQKLPYDQLSPQEQAKDRAIIQQAITLLTERS